MFNRILTIIAIILLGIVIYRAEMRMDRMEDQIEQLGEIVKTDNRIKYTPKDVECLTKNIYYEAGVEGQTGKYAVANVTVNRVNSGKWGNDVCKVVYAKKQFSWTLQKKLPKPHPTLWEESKQIAVEVLEGTRVFGLENSLFYHADYIRHPKWAHPDEHILTIGRHLFYNNAKRKDNII
jgi:spore germination cell wall hydrolase CwlJ-like protein